MSYNLCFSYPYMAALGIFGFIIFLLVGVVQIYAGFIGIDYLFGYWWAVAAVGASFLLRIMLPLTIGTFFGALEVWGWPWYGALALAAPGLLFAIPAMTTVAVSSAFNRK